MALKTLPPSDLIETLGAPNPLRHYGPLEQRRVTDRIMDAAEAMPEGACGACSGDDDAGDALEASERPARFDGGMI